MADKFLNTDFTRDRWGRPLIAQPDGKPIPYQRISSFGTVLENQFGLNKWRMRTMLKGALDRPDLRARAESKIDDDRFLDDICEQLLEHGGGSKAANLGTAIHEVLSNLDMGTITLDKVPADFRAHAEAWQTACADMGLTVVPDLVECHLVNDEFRAAGSGDNFLRAEDGTLIVVDKKTGKSMAPRPLAYMVQLYLYATSVRYDIATGERHPIGNVNTEVAYIAHLPAADTTCTFYAVDLGEARRLTELAAAVKDAERATAKVTPARPGTADRVASVEPTTSASPSRVAAPLASPDRITWLRDRIQHLFDTHPEVKPRIVASWPTDVPTLRAGGLTDDDVDKVAKMLDPIEGELGVPFGASDPAKAFTDDARDEAMLRAAFPAAEIVDNTPDIDAETYEALQHVYVSLSDEDRAWVNDVARQARAAGNGFALSERRSQRRASLMAAVIGLSELRDAPDALRVVVRAVTGTDTDNLGATLGALSIQQITYLRLILDGLNNGTIALTYDDGGAVVGMSGQPKKPTTRKKPNQ